LEDKGVGQSALPKSMASRKGYNGATKKLS